VAADKNYYLNDYLAPIKEYLAQDGVTEVSINQPGAVWVEKYGVSEVFEDERLSHDHLDTLARLIAGYCNQEINENFPLLSASLPDGERIQIVIPPAAPNGIAMSIRKPTILDLTLDDYEKAGSFEGIDYSENKLSKPEIQNLKSLYREGKTKLFFQEAVIHKQNILISGGTSTGKTTFLNALVKNIPPHERLISIEDTREVKLSQSNQLNLLASKGDQGLAKVTVESLLETSLRLRPDRIILGELRGAEAFTYLRAINTGHPGSISTLHADTPDGAIDQLSLMVLQAGRGLGRDEIKDYITGMIDVIIQLERVGKIRKVTDVKFLS